jgi:hypothetical protein
MITSRVETGSNHGEKGESVDKPGSVVDDHSSATGVTTCL